MFVLVFCKATVRRVWGFVLSSRAEALMSSTMYVRMGLLLTLRDPRRQWLVEVGCCFVIL